VTDPSAWFVAVSPVSARSVHDPCTKSAFACASAAWLSLSTIHTRRAQPSDRSACAAAGQRGACDRGHPLPVLRGRPPSASGARHRTRGIGNGIPSSIGTSRMVRPSNCPARSRTRKPDIAVRPPDAPGTALCGCCGRGAARDYPAHYRLPAAVGFAGYRTCRRPQSVVVIGPGASAIEPASSDATAWVRSPPPDHDEPLWQRGAFDPTGRPASARTQPRICATGLRSAVRIAPRPVPREAVLSVCASSSLKPLTGARSEGL
jgi:hypothetical protein